MVAAALWMCNCDGQVLLKTSPPVLTVNTDELAFGAIPVHNTVKHQLTLVNYGEQLLEISQVQCTGEAFAVSEGSLSIPAASEIKIQVRFSPLEIRDYSAALNIDSNANNANRISVALTGQGVSETTCGPCLEPPPPTCLTDTDWVHYDLEGTCVNDECQYRAIVEACAHTCDADSGRCAVGVDGGVQDTSSPLDSSTPDAGLVDTSVVDTGAIDAGTRDAASVDVPNPGIWYELSASATREGISGQPPGRKSWPPCLVLDSQARPVVAWSDTEPEDSEIYVVRYNGSGWVEFGVGSASGGGVSNDQGESFFPRLALDAVDHPVVTWHDTGNGYYAVFAKRFTGSAWEEIGAGSASAQGIAHSIQGGAFPVLGMRPGGEPIIAWQQSSNAYIKRFDGSDWVEVGAGSASGSGVSQTTGDSNAIELAVDATGIPVVGWHDDTSGNFEVYLKRFDGSTWVEIGTGSASGGGISDNSGTSASAAIAIDANGHPVVAWHDDTSGRREVYLKRFDGSAWLEIGPGSASAGGISLGAGNSASPAIALDANDHPIVAWSDNISGNKEIYVKRYNGSTWTEVGTGSASGGGISSSPQDSEQPSIAVHGNRACVAWNEGTIFSTLDVWVKCTELD